MTPYELRFEIFKEAVKLSDMQYQTEYCAASMWNENNSVKIDYPQFPSYNSIEELANKINNFVSSNTTSSSVKVLAKLNGETGELDKSTGVFTQRPWSEVEFNRYKQYGGK